MAVTFPVKKAIIHSMVDDEFVRNFPNSNFTQDRSGRFSYKTKSHWLRVGYGILTYNHHVILPSFSALIMHRELEGLILPILRRHDMFGGKPTDLVPSFSGLFPEEYSAPPYAFEEQLDILSVDDVIPVAKKFSFFFERVAMPHFEKCSDLSYVWSIVEKLKGREENANFLGPHWQFYRCGLMKCLGIPGAKEFALEFEEQRREIAEKIPDENIVIQYHEASKDLLELVS